MLHLQFTYARTIRFTNFSRSRTMIFAPFCNDGISIYTVSVLLLSFLQIGSKQNTCEAIHALCVIGGDMQFMEGQVLGHESLECVNSTFYEGQWITCGSDGKPSRTSAVFSCPENQYCVQCGARRRGGALCLDADTTGDLNCDFGEDYNDDGCLVGENNEAVPVGHIITPMIPRHCVENTKQNSYWGYGFRCGASWFSEAVVQTETCPTNTKCLEENGSIECKKLAQPRLSETNQESGSFSRYNMKNAALSLMISAVAIFMEI